MDAAQEAEHRLMMAEHILDQKLEELAVLKSAGAHNFSIDTAIDTLLDARNQVSGQAASR